MFDCPEADLAALGQLLVEAAPGRALERLERFVQERRAPAEPGEAKASWHEPASLSALRLLARELDQRALTVAASEERLQMLSSASFEGILIHHDGIVLDMNERMSEILGTSREEMVGTSNWRESVHPEDLPTVFEKVRTAYEGSYVLRAVRRDGSPFVAELLSKQAKLGERPVRVVAIRDVTERERTLALLRESEQRLLDLIDTAFDFAILSRDGIILDVQGDFERVVNIRKDEVIGWSIYDLIAPAVRQVVEQAVQSRVPERYRTVIVNGEGEMVPVEVISVLSSFDGQPTRIAGVRDLRASQKLDSERRRLEQQVERLQRLDSLGMLAGGIAHDFNNLLVGVLGNADLLLGSSLDETQEQLVAGICAAGQRAAALTSRLLAYSGHGDVAPPKPLLVRDLIDEVERLSSVSRARGVVFETDVSPGSVVLGDGTTLSQVILNLLNNAVEALGNEGGSISVKAVPVREPDARFDEALGATVRPGHWILIEIADTGSGMDPATKARIFEPFFTTKSRGHGLGLASCLGIVQAHGGALHVDSELGQGSRFSLLLPAAQMTESKRVPVSELRISPCRVLVVDDHHMVRAQVRRSLELRGFEVTEADSGAACLEVLLREPHDLVLLDLSLPSDSGLEVLSVMRERGVDVPVVLMSGYADARHGLMLQSGAFQEFLAKPFGIGELLDAIERARGLRSPGSHSPVLGSSRPR